MIENPEIIMDSVQALERINKQRGDSGPIIWGYGRASDEKQSLTQEAQYQIVKEWADKHQDRGRWGGFFYDFAVTSKIFWAQRKMGRVLWSGLRNGDTIVAALYDRAMREPKDWYTTQDVLVSRKILLVLLDMPEHVDYTTPVGELLYSLMASIKRFERRMIGWRTSNALQVKKRNGLPYSGHRVPPGWKVSGFKKNSKFVPDNDNRRMSLYVVWLIDVLKLSWDKVVIRNIKERFATRPWSAVHRGMWRTDDPTLLGADSLQRCYKAALAGFPLPNGDRIQSIEGIDLFDAHKAIRQLQERDGYIYRWVRTKPGKAPDDRYLGRPVSRRKSPAL